MPNQDATLSMPAMLFSDFSAAISTFNKRTEKVNAKLKKAKYQKVNRFPVSHEGDMVTVTVAIKDRSKVLWQELSAILDHYRALGFSIAADKRIKGMPAKAVSSPVQPVSRQWGLWVPCADEAAARAAAGFLQAIAKVGTPQVECRG